MREYKAVFLWALCLAGCNSDSRLRLMDADSGLLFDSELDTPCGMMSWNGTEARCVPPIPQTVMTNLEHVYVDSQCRVLAVPSTDPAAKMSSYPFRTGVCAPSAFYRLGKVHSGPLYYKSGSDCRLVTAPPAEGVTYHVAGELVLPEAFASATLIHGEEERLNEAFWQTADGLRATTRNTVFHDGMNISTLAQPLYFDSERAELCTARNACDGKVRCMPFSHMTRVAMTTRYYGYLMADFDCQQSLVYEGPGNCFYKNTSSFPVGEGCASYARTGAKVRTSFSLLDGQTCRRIIAGGDFDMRIVEERLPDDVFAEFPALDTP